MRNLRRSACTTRRPRWPVAVVCLALAPVLAWALQWPVVLAQSLGAQAQAHCTITGIATAGPARLPGVTIVTTPAAGSPISTSTLLDGSYSLTVPGAGNYVLKAELAAFAPAVREVTVDSSCQARVDFQMMLASRVPPAAGEKAAVPAAPITQAASQARGRGAQFQRVAPVADASGIEQQARAAQNPTGTADAETVTAHLSLPPGFSTETLSETVAAFGSTGQTNEMLLFGGAREGMMIAGRGGMFGGPAGENGLPTFPGFDAIAGQGPAGMGPGGLGPGGPGGRGGGMGPGGRGGGPGGGMGGGRGGMGPGGGLNDRLAMAGRLQNRRQLGQVAYTLGGSPLDSKPYSLNGQATSKPDYLQQRMTASIGGPVRIPKLFDMGPRANFFLNYSGNHSTTAHSTYSTVPTLAERQGDFSGAGVDVVDPTTGLPFPGNRISAIDPAAAALLKYIPEPNQPGDRQNFYYSTTTRTSSDDLNFRFTRSFGAQQRGRGGRGGARAAAPAARGGGGGRGGALMNGGMNLNVGLHWQRSKSTQSNAFPTIAGRSHGTGWDVPVSFNIARWGMMHALRFGYNRSESRTTNLFAYVQDVTGDAGIAGVATDPFDWGAPTLSFATVAGLRDINPSIRSDRTITFGDTIVKMRNRHTLRFGGDFRDVTLRSRTDSSARGNFVFTGLYTGADFADFLLGLPQQASIQYGPGLLQYHTRSWNLFIQDDWRVATRLTINAGVRYEYQSPYSEANNHLVTLDVNDNFTAAVPVIAGQQGPFGGAFPTTIVRPDRNNLSPRIGIAWRPQQRTMLRGGYAINYSSVPYMSFAQRMAGQPPFAVTDTRLGTVASPILFTDAFGTPIAATTTNNFAVDPNYRLGYVHIWNVDFQRELARTMNVGVAYTGTRGAQLDLQRAPNRGPSGLRIAGVQPFIWESSGARSIMHSISFRVQRRLAQGASAGATYTYSRARDNASSLSGGGGGVVAQNDQDLEAEWGASSFDQRHRFTANFSVELPFGENRRWLTRKGIVNTLAGGWVVNGNVSAASGSPFTPRVTNATSDVAAGVSGTLRANYNGQPVEIADPTLGRYFNTEAFSVPAPGTFGSAGRNSIYGPGSGSVNMALQKSFALPGTRGLSLRVQANNVFNTVQFSTIDTVVNSKTFGRVVGVRPMRSAQLILRVMF